MKFKEKSIEICTADAIYGVASELPRYELTIRDCSTDWFQTNVFSTQKVPGHFVILESQGHSNSQLDSFGTFSERVREVVHTLEEADTRAYALTLQKAREPQNKEYGSLENKVQISPEKRLPWGGKAE